MKLVTALALFAVGTVLAFDRASAQQASNLGKSHGTAVNAQVSVGPSLEDLIDKLRDLRARKAYDWTHGRKYQAYLAQKIEMVKQALRNHHREAGRKAAMNEPMDYDPPRK